MADVRDWRNIPVANTGPDVPVTHWECEPHPTSREFTSLVERSMPDFLESMRDGLEEFLEQFTEEELREGVTLTIRLRDIAPADVEEKS